MCVCVEGGGCHFKVECYKIFDCVCVGGCRGEMEEGGCHFKAEFHNIFDSPTLCVCFGGGGGGGGGGPSSLILWSNNYGTK